MESLELKNNLKGSEFSNKKDRYNITDSGSNNRRIKGMKKIFDNENSSYKTELNSAKTEIL